MFLYWLKIIIVYKLSHAAIVSTSAGRVSDIVITSREVVINYMIEEALVSPDAKSQKLALKPQDIKSAAFIRETTAALFETAIYLEAESFSETAVSEAVVESKAQDVIRKLKTNKDWKKLEVANREIKNILRRKLRAKDFIRFKIDSVAITITDQEAQDYFDNNRLKFENLNFSNFKENIKSYLTKQQADKRLKDWFELLQSKYRVHNFLAERSY
ncbi:MAG: hypothetical protein A2Z20_05105 [Bdellovibrionales bacterium RBG_16_40_8]|nr:MAG: hypothetical protein A2Z20_05105 [Bdellovibrionales bacterium RBG_16_40_8]